MSSAAGGMGLAISFSHVGLFVREIDRMNRFYCEVLGFLQTDRGMLPGAELSFLSRDPSEHHQLVLVSGRPPGLPDRILNQLSFRLRSLDDLKILYWRLPGSGAADMDPVIHGTAWSLYFRDPEGNRIEAFVDSDWYIPQPRRIPLDLSLPVDAIYAETKAFCEAQPGCRPLRDWQVEFAQRLAARLAAPETAR